MNFIARLLRQKSQTTSGIRESKDLLAKGVTAYRKSQPRYLKGSLVFPEFDREKGLEALDLLNQSLTVDPDNTEALLLWVHCAADLRDPGMIYKASLAIDRAIDAFSDDPRAHYARGSIYYWSVNLGDDVNRKLNSLRRAAESYRRVLDLDPNFASDLGINPAMQSTTSHAYQSFVAQVEQQLERLLASQSRSPEEQKASIGQFNSLHTDSVDEGLHCLFEAALTVVPEVSEAEVAVFYSWELRSKWGSKRLLRGSVYSIDPLLRKFLATIRSRPEFGGFTVDLPPGQSCAQIAGFVSYNFYPVRLWRTASGVLACGNSMF